jgi:hypothetical protein
LKHKSALEQARAELDRIEKESERLFKGYRLAYYRRITGELKTDRVLNAAREDMEAAVIEAGNAYLKLVALERRPEVE